MENKNDRKGAIKKLKLLTFGSKSNVDAFRAKLDEGFKTVFLPRVCFSGILQPYPCFGGMGNHKQRNWLKAQLDL